jgi:hypothetical protein
MTFLVEWLAELRKHLDHLCRIRPRVDGASSLERDLSLHNDAWWMRWTIWSRSSSSLPPSPARARGEPSAAARLPHPIRCVSAGTRPSIRAYSASWPR